MHKLLERQLKRHLNLEASAAIPEPWKRFLEIVNQAYEQSDEDRRLLERSLDLTSQELIQRNQELTRSNEELQQFAYAVSHDLQEPLRIIKGFGQLLSRRYRDKLDLDGEEFITHIVDGSERMSQLIEDILAYSRVGTRGQMLGATDCNTALDRALSNLQVALGETQCKVTHEVLPKVLGDSSQLTQLFQNLLSNAIKFRKKTETPRIHIFAKQDNGLWRLAVQDEGIGMEAQYTTRIFEIFQRLHSREEYEGTGIGLAICKKIVNRHGGTIWVASELGKGSTFFFTLQPPTTPAALSSSPDIA